MTGTVSQADVGMSHMMYTGPELLHQLLSKK